MLITNIRFYRVVDNLAQRNVHLKIHKIIAIDKKFQAPSCKRVDTPMKGS